MGESLLFIVRPFLRDLSSPVAPEPNSQVKKLMMLFKLNRTVTCVAILIPLLLAIPSFSRCQEPTVPTEKVAVTDSDTIAGTTLRNANAGPAAVAINAEPKQTEPVAITSTKEIAAPKIETPAEDTPSKKQDATDDSGWHFAVTPYLFLSGLTGTVGARGHAFDLKGDFGSDRENFVIGFMAAVEARKGRFVILNDLVWANLTSEKDTPGPLYSTAKVGAKIFILDPEAGYRFVNSEKGSVDVLAGVRVWSVEASLKTTTGVLPGFDVSQRKTWAAPVIGVRGVANITPRFFLAGKFDIGGAGIGADLTTQLYGAAGYKFTKHFALLGGYRWLQVDYDDESGFLFDTVMSGPMFGMKFSW